MFFSGENLFLNTHASEHFPNTMLPCQTACHQPENMIKAHLNKRQSAKCQACHSESAIIPKVSPFNSNPKLKSTRVVPKLLANQVYSSQSISIQSSPTSNTSSTQKPEPQAPLNMVYIPQGKFIMGSNDRWDDETPEFITSTEDYFIDLYEVTNQDYQIYVTESGVEPPLHWPGGTTAKTQQSHPVVYVNWFDAVNYCHWAGKRLPTEKEWEKAARGVDGNIYPWGNLWDLNKSNNPYAHSTGTKPVGSYPEGKSTYGLFDMSGNVWEWVDNYYLPHPGNIIWRPEYGKKNRILKGGSWFDCLSYGCGLSAPTFNRSFFTPEVRNNSFGFRCAKTADNHTTTINNN